MSFHTAHIPCSTHVVQTPIHPLRGTRWTWLYSRACSPAAPLVVCMWYVPAQQCAHPCTVTPTCNCYAGYTPPRTYRATWDALALAYELQGH